MAQSRKLWWRCKFAYVECCKPWRRKFDWGNLNHRLRSGDEKHFDTLNEDVAQGLLAQMNQIHFVVGKRAISGMQFLHLFLPASRFVNAQVQKTKLEGPETLAGCSTPSCAPHWQPPGLGV